LDLKRQELGLRREGMKMKAQGAGMKPPPGYRFLPDGSLEPIPGGPAARKIDAEEGRKQQAKDTWARQGTAAIQDARRALELI
jgi:hypothetical protein